MAVSIYTEIYLVVKNMIFKILVEEKMTSKVQRTSTIQPAAPKELSKVHFNILNLKDEIWPDFLCIFWKILKIIFLTTKYVSVFIETAKYTHFSYFKNDFFVS